MFKSFSPRVQRPKLSRKSRNEASSYSAWTASLKTKEAMPSGKYVALIWLPPHYLPMRQETEQLIINFLASDDLDDLHRMDTDLSVRRYINGKASSLDETKKYLSENIIS